VKFAKTARKHRLGYE